MRHLPACVYRRHGAYWYVKGGKWTRLGAELPEALSNYAGLLESRKRPWRGAKPLIVLKRWQ